MGESLLSSFLRACPLKLDFPRSDGKLSFQEFSDMVQSTDIVKYVCVLDLPATTQSVKLTWPPLSDK
jgi:hypothetical protein